jgi:serine/threonine protein kinase
LVNSDCTLKLADFGLARVFHDGVDHTSLAITEYITTRWYRAPEILAGWSSYGKSIDMWAVGCIVGELFKRGPLFPGGDSVKQLELLLTSLGRPEESFTIKCKKSSKR